jgi:hypothetical protein
MMVDNQSCAAFRTYVVNIVYSAAIAKGNCCQTELECLSPHIKHCSMFIITPLGMMVQACNQDLGDEDQATLSPVRYFS